MSLTKDLYDLIVKIVEDKVRDIKVTREEFEKLSAAVRDLAEAQRRTEERLDKLAETVDHLAEAQRRTEERLDKLAETVDHLAKAVDNLRVELGSLSETIGFGLEDIAKVVLPGWLYRHLGVEVELERRFLYLGDREIEVDLYGEYMEKESKLIIVGEAKSRIYGRDVEKFYNEVYRPIADHFKNKAKVIGVLFGYLIHPSAQRMAQKLGIYTVASYQR